MKEIKKNWRGKEIVKKDTCNYCKEKKDCTYRESDSPYFEDYGVFVSICEICRRYEEIKDKELDIKLKKEQEEEVKKYIEERDKFLESYKKEARNK